MAEMIPDRLPSGSSKGEQRVFAILQRLPDDWIAYYEPVISDRYPDFVVIAPDLGVIVIEVKGWNPNDILGGDHQNVRIQNRGVERNEAHPVRQARGYQNNFQDECRKSREARSLLLNASGKYEGRFVFPFCHFAILSNISSEQLTGHRLGDLSVLFPPSRVLPRDGLLRWEGLSEDSIRESLRGFFDPFWVIPGLSARQVDLLRGVIHPEIRIESRYDPSQLAILDMRQERHARGIGNGHRIVYGVAGSGKTVLLTQQGWKTAVGGEFPETTHDPAQAVATADVIYTDVWTSMGQEAERDERLHRFAPVPGQRRANGQGPEALQGAALPARPPRRRDHRRRG